MSVNRIIATPELSDDLRAALLQDADALIDQGVILKHDRTTTVVKLQWQGSQYLLKRYNARNAWHIVKRSLRQSRAQRCWNASSWFQSAGISVAEPVAMLEKRYGPFCGTAYFLTRFVEAVELLEWLPEQPDAVQQTVKQQLTHLFQNMRQHQLTHGDMKATNLLWDGEKVVLIDLDAATQHSVASLWRKRFRRDLRRFRRNGPVFANVVDTVSA